MGSRKAIEAQGDCFFERLEYSRAMKHYLVAYMLEGDCIDYVHALSNSVGVCCRRLGCMLSSRWWFRLAKDQGNEYAHRNLARLELF